MKNSQKINEQIQEIIAECHNEELQEKSGMPVDSNAESRRYILDEMHQLLSNEQLIYEKTYLESFAMAFRCWEWDMQHPSALYKHLVKLNKEIGENE